MRAPRTSWATVAAIGVLVACGGGAPPDPPPDADAPLLPPPDAVDILFLVDTSCEAGMNQELLAEAAEVLFRELVEPTDDGSGDRAPPVHDLHVGVTTLAADMAGYLYVGCLEPELGALVLERPRECQADLLSAADCAEPPCPWLRHTSDAPRERTIWEDAACLVRYGACGCGWEQPLEAMRLALTVQSEPGGPNHGFVRESSVLVLVVMTNEDDCSVADPLLFDREAIEEHPNLRCHLHEDMLHPAERYVEMLHGLRPGLEDRIVVGVLAGFPTDGSWSPGDPVEALRAMIQVDPSEPQALQPRCPPPWGYAVPAPRLVELAQAFGDGAVVASICQPDWSEAMMGLARAIQRRLR